MSKTPELDRLKRIGAGMANSMFNLAHNEALPADIRQSLKDQQREWDAAIAALQSAADTPAPSAERVRHKKRGSEYEVIGVGRMQTEDWSEEVLGADEDGRNAWVNESIDMREVTIYRSVDDGSLWVRPTEEFNDGRFEALPPFKAKEE